ncbi:LysR family transcriptional regulator [Methylorubrum populi]|uniref:Transcriptional regulator, LysR family n=3 Tax=Methylorubrum TaxID=2282523 RepID=B1ZDB8_METPB|nr:MULTISPECIES: LysR family transcriptional regulator [Methylorubrum]ACB82326.1 transcriptional regulator, LysR family [Methylorubrum populi BJ001]MBA8914691.1 DNA-binding transcriptional LysR family regulator [Methylorubrum thiocyanatum]PZP66478.1 MAG: LysR family transcriptional regulator [Methylorubrum populi]QDI82302.1 LysR family transcriptional regulator [Methylorubrum populi]GJE81705.1 HTH-type transcriptional regulator HdfR [Methylorubrum thiocyanatum]
MNWDHLQVFLAVARHSQMLEAGRRLGLNHATVARRLDALEAALGTPLFHRRPNGSALTEAGEQLVPVAERIEAEVLAVAARMRAQEAEPSGTVRIGAPDGLGTLFLARELGLFASRYANLVIELVPLPRSFSLSRREADLAIGLDRPAHGRLILSKLSDYSLGLYAAKAYLDRAGMPESVADLGSHAAVIGVDDYAYASALDYTAFLQDRVARVFRCVGAVAQLEAVRAGAGLGILHDFAAAALPDLVRILPETAFRRSYWLMSHPDDHGSRRIAACRDFLARRFREERDRFLPPPAALRGGAG